MLGGSALGLAMNRLTSTIGASVLVWLAATVTALFAIGKEAPGNDPLVMYSRAAIVEFCQKNDVEQCPEIAKWVDDSDYEVFRYGSGNTSQYLVIFTHAVDVYLPFVVLALDKDGWLRVVTRGVHLGEKRKFIETFEQEGDFAR